MYLLVLVDLRDKCSTTVRAYFSKSYKNENIFRIPNHLIYRSNYHDKYGFRSIVSIGKTSQLIVSISTFTALFQWQSIWDWRRTYVRIQWKRTFFVWFTRLLEIMRKLEWKIRKLFFGEDTWFHNIQQSVSKYYCYSPTEEMTIFTYLVGKGHQILSCCQNVKETIILYTFYPFVLHERLNGFLSVYLLKYTHFISVCLYIEMTDTRSIYA